jgi:hypothetical protein
VAQLQFVIDARRPCQITLYYHILLRRNFTYRLQELMMFCATTKSLRTGGRGFALFKLDGYGGVKRKRLNILLRLLIKLGPHE